MGLRMPPPGRRMVVTGLPRSGTSWVGKVLSFAPGFTYFREPDNYDHVTGALDYFAHLYLPSGSDDPGYRTHMDAVFAGEIRTAFTLKQDRGPLLSRLPPAVADGLGSKVPLLYGVRRDQIVKLVRSNLALEFVSDTWPHTELVLTMRHPCGMFDSWRTRGWEPDPTALLCDEALVVDHLTPYVDLIAGAETFWQRAGAYWGAIWTVLHAQLQTRPWLVVQHEWLCDRPTERFRDLYDALSLPWTPRVERSVRGLDVSGTGAPYSVQRSAAAERDKWKHRLTPAEIAECRTVVEAFGLPYYPDFEPVADQPRWLPSSATGALRSSGQPVGQA